MQHRDDAPYRQQLLLGLKQDRNAISPPGYHSSHQRCHWIWKTRTAQALGRQLLSGLKQDGNAIGSPSYPAIHERRDGCRQQHMLLRIHSAIVNPPITPHCFRQPSKYMLLTFVVIFAGLTTVADPESRACPPPDFTPLLPCSTPAKKTTTRSASMPSNPARTLSQMSVHAS